MKESSWTILFFHGSRHPSTALEAKKLQETLEGRFPQKTFSLAFLPPFSPDLAGVLEDAANRGAREIQILPFFVLTGKHVEQDLPELIRDFQGRFPEVRVTTASHFVVDQTFIDWVAQKMTRIA